MAEANDIALLREFAGHNSETAFAELVRRHINLVYSVALRLTGNIGDAQDVTQAVFIILTRKAAALSARTVLTGWLYETTRFTASRLLRTRARRRAQEHEASMQSILDESASDDVWRQLAPHLEAAMSRLTAADRALLALRYYENKTSAEAAALLGIREDAARKRINRALEKLHRAFARRGISSTTAIIAEAISANSISAVPLALAKTVTTLALAKGAAAPISTLTLIKGTLKVMAWTKTKTAIVVGVGVLFTAGITTVAVRTVHVIRAASAPDIQGSWEGVATILGVPGMSPGENARSRVVFHFFKTNGAYTATGVWIDTAPDPFQVANFTYDYPFVRFAVGQNFTFAGKLQAGATEITATQRRGGLSAPIVLKRTAAADAAPEPLAKNEYVPRAGSDLQGVWTANLGVRAVRVAIKIAEPSPGIFRAELDNLSTSWLGQPVAVTYHPPEVKLQVVSGAGMFQGEMRNGNTEMVGNFSQGGGQTPLVFHRADY